MTEPARAAAHEKSAIFEDWLLVIPRDRWKTKDPIPRFGDLDEWRLQGLGRPVNQGGSWGLLNFAKLAPNFSLLGREIAMCMLNPRHFSLLRKGIYYAHQPASPSTVQRIIQSLLFLQEHQRTEGLPSCVGDWDIQDLRDAAQVPLKRGRVPDSVATFARWLETNQGYSQAITGGYPNGRLWTPQERRQWDQTKRQTRGEIRTPPIPPATFFPLVEAAVAYVRDFSEDILYARRRSRDLCVDEPFPGMTDEEIQKVLADPTTRIPLHTTGRLRGKPNHRALSLYISGGRSGQLFTSPHIRLQERRRALLEPYLQQGKGQLGMFDVRARGHGARSDHPWHEDFTPTSIDPEIAALRAACYIVIAVTTLMRDSEIQQIEKGSLTEYYGAPAIRSELVKGQADNPGMYWWLHPVGADAVKLAEKLSDHETHIFSSLRDMPWTDRTDETGAGIAAGTAIRTFTEHVNKNLERTGLKPIPHGDKVTPHQFRRTMAIQVGSRPGGELALGLILKHVSARMLSNSSTIGYATPSAAWLEEYDDLRSQEYMATVAATWIREPGVHRAVGGPGGEKYNKTYDAVTADQAPQIIDKSQLVALLRTDTPGLRVGTVNHCLGDKSKARCITSSNIEEAEIDPLRCEPASCANSVVTRAHIPLLASELSDVKSMLRTRGISEGSAAMLEARGQELSSLIGKGEAGE